jgi:anti-anti-sigma factor
MAYIGIRERRVGNVSILEADSEVRIGLRFGASAVPLLTAVESLLDDGQDEIILNLARVPSIDARGLGEIVSAAIATSEKGGRMKLLRLTENVRQIMTKAQLLTVFEVFDVESRAIQSFSSGLNTTAELSAQGNSG